MCIQAQHVSFTEFINNTVTGPRKLFNGVFVGSSLIFLDAVVNTISLSKFFHNRASFAIVHLPYYRYTAAENFTKNFFNNNNAGFEVYTLAPPASQVLISL